MYRHLYLGSLVLGCVLSTSAQALDEKEIMLRAITTVDLCYTSGDATKIKALAFGAGIDLANLTAEQAATVAETKSLYAGLPWALKSKVCAFAKNQLKDFP